MMINAHNIDATPIVKGDFLPSTEIGGCRTITYDEFIAWGNCGFGNITEVMDSGDDE